MLTSPARPMVDAQPLFRSREFDYTNEYLRPNR